MDESKAKLTHIAAMVSDIDATIEAFKKQWTPVGIDTWTKIHYAPKGEQVLAGQEIDIYSGLTMLSPTVEMNVIQHNGDLSTITHEPDGAWFARGYNMQRGDSIEHIAWSVPDFENKIKEMQRVGFFNVSSCSDGASRWVQLRSLYMPGGFGIELLEAGMHDYIRDMLDKEEAKGGPDPKFYRFAEIGLLVYDLERATDGLRPAFDILGIDEFNKFELALDKKDMVYGEPFTMKMAQVMLNDQVEMLIHQPVSGGNALTEYLQNKKEGIAYMGFRVKNYDEVAAEVEKRGYKMLLSAKCQASHVRYAWFDSGYTQTGTMIKLIEMEPKK